MKENKLTKLISAQRTSQLLFAGPNFMQLDNLSETIANNSFD